MNLKFHKTEGDIRFTSDAGTRRSNLEYELHRISRSNSRYGRSIDNTCELFQLFQRCILDSTKEHRVRFVCITQVQIFQAEM